jgi:DNA-binding PadR family transcriptional regulator
MTAIATARSKTSALADVEDQETYVGFVRLYVLCCASEEAISSRGISEELAARGWIASPRSLSQLVRGLERNGYLKSEEIGHGRKRHTVYRATRQGRFATKQAQGKLRNLFAALSLKDMSCSNLRCNSSSAI